MVDCFVLGDRGKLADSACCWDVTGSAVLQNFFGEPVAFGARNVLALERSCYVGQHDGSHAVV